MPYWVSGAATFSTQANRDAAVTRVNAALSTLGLSAQSVGDLPAGVSTPTSTTMTLSFFVGNDSAAAAAASSALYSAWTSSNRHSQGYLTVSRT